MRIKGIVKWYSMIKHFGFLLTDEDNREVFFHINECQGFSPEEGMNVEFELGKDGRGRTKAMKIVTVGVCNEKITN